MIGVEIFSGPGGMGLGAKYAGIDIALAVEKNFYAAQTYLENHKGTTVVPEDIKNIQEFSFKKKSQGVVLFGGPPCQGYSNANRKTRFTNNPKNWLFMEFMRSVDIVKPDWVVIENVPGLKNLDKGFFLEEICNNLHSRGYTPNFKILNAVDFGVPQKRERIFIVASLHGIAFEFPIGNFKDKIVTVDEAFSDLPFLNNGSKEDVLTYKCKAESDYAKLMRGKKRKVSQNYVSKNIYDKVIIGVIFH